MIATLFSLAAIVVGGTALANLASARDRVVNKIDPAAFRTSQLGVAYLNQETGVRGYALSARPTFLAPYTDGLAQERRQVSALRRLLTGMPAAAADLTQVTARAGIWRARYAEPTIRQVRATGKPVTGATTNQGKAEFDALRAALDGLQADLTSERRQAVAGLNGSATTLNAICLGIGISLLVILIVLAFSLEISVIRPLSRLAADARTVADGDFTHHVDPGGPQEVRTVGIDVNRMRERILAELSAVRAAHTRAWRRRTRAWRPGPRTCSGRTRNSSSSPTWPPMTCRSRCGRWRASPAAAAPLRGPAGRKGRPVHRARRRRRQAHAAADQ